MDYDFKDTLDSLIWSTNDQVEFKKLTDQVRDVNMNLRNKFRTSAYQVKSFTQFIRSYLSWKLSVICQISQQLVGLP